MSRGGGESPLQQVVTLLQFLMQRVEALAEGSAGVAAAAYTSSHPTLPLPELKLACHDEVLDEEWVRTYLQSRVDIPFAINHHAQQGITLTSAVIMV